jgi:hypothetical protein
MKTLSKSFLLAIYFFLLIIPSCQIVPNVYLESDPPGAQVYLIPKIELDLDSSILCDPAKLSKYLVPEGVTPVTTRAREMVYVVLFSRNGQFVERKLDVIYGQINKAKAVFP